MNTNFIESKETFIISFGGENSIDAQTFSYNKSPFIISDLALFNKS